MKKLRCMLVFSLVFALFPMASFAKSMEFTISSDIAYVSDNGISPISLDASPVVSNNRTLVPIRVIAENFGADVLWDAAERTVKISKSDLDMLFKIDDTTAYINGEAVTLDTAPQIINDRTMLPLRFISESLKMNVEYVSSTKQIYITDESPVMNVNGSNIYLDDFRFFMASPEDYDYALNGLKEIYTLGSLAEYSTELSSEDAEFIKNSMKYYKDYTLILSVSAARLYEKYVMAEKYLNDIYYSTDASLSDSEIEEIYDNDYVCAKHILVSDKTLANDILKKIKIGMDFDTLMNKYSEDPGLKSYPDGYVFTSGEMVSEFESAAFSLNAGQVSDVVQSEYGYHIIKRESLPDIDDSIKAQINDNATENMRNQFIEFVMSAAPVETYMTKEEVINALK